jgi:integrase
MKKRTYGTGSFRQVSEGKYELRYRKQTTTVSAQSNKQADRELQKWVKLKDEEVAVGPAVLLNRLLDLHLADKRRKRASDVLSLERKIEKHIRPALGSMNAQAIKNTDLKKYIDGRIVAGAANATINRELSAIRRALNIGLSDELIPKAPSFKELLLPEDNARQGFVEDDTYRALLKELASHAQLPWCFSYYTGVRVGELLKIEWSWVDWSRSVIIIPGVADGLRVTKNKKKRIIPVYSDMIPLVQAAYQTRNPECPHMFQKHGKRLRSFRTAFENARKRLGLESVIFHDLRRTAVRNMERAGIPRTIARQVSGHLTESVYIRYAIGAEKDALEVGDKMTNFHREERARATAENEQSPNVGENCGAAVAAQERKDSPQTASKRKQ